MPKKKQTHSLKQFQGSSSTSHKANAGQDGSPTASVNERLEDLRKAESLEAAQKKRDLAELVSQRSVPPELRGILGFQESAPPKAKLGIRVRDRDRMRTPGPAPPRSWLYSSASTSTFTARGGNRKGRKAVLVASERNRPDQPLRFARMVGTDGAPPGLQHLTLKRLAEQWDLFDEEDFPALIEIPLRLRLRLLSYLGCYGPIIDAVALRALTQGDEPLTQLDLGGLASHGPLTLRKLIRAFEPERLAATTVAEGGNILDSWDAEKPLEAALAWQPSISRFASLTHLCLSHPPPTAPWRDLLSLAKHVPQLTHLSLAYWPRPTLTPHLATVTVSSQHSPDVRAGGSHYYSGLDQDFTEPASLLRQLSGNLLCLQWLDLEGCAEWVPALATLAAAAPLSLAEEAEQSQGDSWADVKPTVMTIFTDTWRNVTYINCAQGWLPSSAGVEGLGASVDRDIKSGIIGHLLKHEVFPDTVTHDMYEVEKRKARIWAEQEQRLFVAGRRINSIRRARSCRPVVMDFGWSQKAV
ncbi:hypothetical protein LTR36_006747 [Oleoguttula mirabilis]|uniref:Uncharacterized protein n=1 Tax=Oleoguttula mirabilis TaxID=1507867 RepID=A0AAV9JCI3_9PEZI|nr:hypothetical protein LTR36_006747 [Oleoguttula mirabilis]